MCVYLWIQNVCIATMTLFHIFSLTAKSPAAVKCGDSSCRAAAAAAEHQVYIDKVGTCLSSMHGAMVLLTTIGIFLSLCESWKNLNYILDHALCYFNECKWSGYFLRIIRQWSKGQARTYLEYHLPQHHAWQSSMYLLRVSLGLDDNSSQSAM